jgi:siroheme synthase (precorrin-2 oxidase/ferrochelatase)
MTVISPTITEKLQNMVDKGVVIWKEKEFEPTLPFDASPTLLNNVCSGKACFTASLTHGSLVAAIISPTITEKLQNMVDKGVVIWKEKEFEPSDIVDAYLRLVQTLFPSI